MTKGKRFHFGYVCGDTGLIDDEADLKWFIENCCNINDLKKNWIIVCDKLNELADEIEELKEEKDYWKGCSCNHTNYDSILSMDCQIVQEAIFDLKKVIERDTEAFRLLEELDDKFDDLNKHRLNHIRSDD